MLVAWLDGGDLATLQEKLSGLADACVARIMTWLRQETDPSDAATEWLVAALGKLGGGELTVHSDLDLVFVYRGEQGDGARFSRSEALVKKLYRFLEAPTSEGIAYHLDTRLRPEGTKGGAGVTGGQVRGVSGGAGRALGPSSLDQIPRVDRVPGAERGDESSRERLRLRRPRPHAAGIHAAHPVANGDRARQGARRRPVRPEGRSRWSGRHRLSPCSCCRSTMARTAREWRVAGSRRLLAGSPTSPVLDANDAARLREAHLFLRTLETHLRIESDAGTSVALDRPGEADGAGHPHEAAGPRPGTRCDNATRRSPGTCAGSSSRGSNGWKGKGNPEAPTLSLRLWALGFGTRHDKGRASFTRRGRILRCVSERLRPIAQSPKPTMRPPPEMSERSFPGRSPSYSCPSTGCGV